MVIICSLSTLSSYSCYYYLDVDGDLDMIGKPPEDYIEVTIEQLKDHYLKPKNMSKDKKIIGYKCPIDLFGGEIKKGEIFRKMNSKFYKVSLTGVTEYSKHLPREIVESWEPIYEEEYRVGDFVITEGYCDIYDGKVLEITRIKKVNEDRYCFFEPNGSEKHHFNIKSILRKATEEEIAESKVVTYTFTHGVNNDQKSDLEISKKGIYYKSEDTLLTVDHIREMIKKVKTNNLMTVVNTNIQNKTYLFRPIIAHIDVGCKKYTKLSDWEEVLTIYDNLQ